MKKLFCLLMALCSGAQARELEPWFSTSFEFEPQVAYTYAHYTKVGSEFYSSYDQFCHVSLGLTVLNDYNVQLEFQTADTRARSFGPEYAGLTGRYLLLNDVGGTDPVSLAVGLTMLLPWKQSLLDVSVFHHSYFDTEVTLAMGKELSCGPNWTWHFYGIAGLGGGVKGSLWLHGLAGIEKNISDTHRFRIDLDYLQGLGEQPFVSTEDFRGYYNIAHKSLDLGAGYSYHWITYGTVSLDYKERVFSSNCPRNWRGVTLTLLIPFGIGI